MTKYCGWCARYKPADTGKMVMTARNKYKKFKCANCLSAHQKAKNISLCVLEAVATDGGIAHAI